MFWYQMMNDSWKKNNQMKISFKNLGRFMLKLCVIPHSTAEVERGFSMKSDIVTRKRNRLKPRFLNTLMQIKSHFVVDELFSWEPSKEVEEHAKVFGAAYHDSESSEEQGKE